MRGTRPKPGATGVLLGASHCSVNRRARGESAILTVSSYYETLAE